MKDFALNSSNILREAMKWAPNATRSHLLEYLIAVDNTATGLNQHSGLALATEGVLSFVGYNRGNATLAVSHLDANSLVRTYACFLEVYCFMVSSAYSSSMMFLVKFSVSCLHVNKRCAARIA